MPSTLTPPSSTLSSCNTAASMAPLNNNHSHNNQSSSSQSQSLSRRRATPKTQCINSISTNNDVVQQQPVHVIDYSSASSECCNHIDTNSHMGTTTTATTAQPFDDTSAINCYATDSGASVMNQHHLHHSMCHSLPSDAHLDENMATHEHDYGHTSACSQLHTCHKHVQQLSPHQQRRLSAAAADDDARAFQANQAKMVRFVSTTPTLMMPNSHARMHTVMHGDHFANDGAANHDDADLTQQSAYYHQIPPSSSALMTSAHQHAATLTQDYEYGAPLNLLEGASHASHASHDAHDELSCSKGTRTSISNQKYVRANASPNARAKWLLMVSLSALIVLIYVLIGALVLARWQRITYVDALYVCALTLATIGGATEPLLQQRHRPPPLLAAHSAFATSSLFAPVVPSSVVPSVVTSSPIASLQAITVQPPATATPASSAVAAVADHTLFTQSTNQQHQSSIGAATAALNHRPTETSISPTSAWPNVELVCLSAYLFVGLALVSMCTHLWRARTN